MPPTQENQEQAKLPDRVTSAIRAAGGSVKDLDEQQRMRAEAHGDHEGLRGKALGQWILDGQDGGQQARQAQNDRIVRDADAKSKARSAAAKKGGSGSSRARYPDEVRNVVERVKALKGTPHGAPGPKQVLNVQQVVGEGSDARAIVAASGFKSLAELKKVAAGDTDRQSLKTLRPLAEKFDDQFCKGRNLAAMLAAWAEQKG